MDNTESLIPMDPTIKYFRAVGGLTTGDMRNVCAQYARGTIICHFDSDDWSAPERVTDQVTRLGEHGVVTGYNSMLFYDMRDGRCYRWHFSQAPIRYVLGTSLCYRREWWRHHPFPSVSVGEDIRFFTQAQREANRLVLSSPAEGMMVARVHDYQTCRKSLNKTSYMPMPKQALPQAFPCALTSSAI